MSPVGASRRHRSSRRLLGLIAVPCITTRPRMRTSPSSASLISAPGETGPDGADLDRSGGLSCRSRRSPTSPTAPRAGSRGRGRTDHLPRRRRGADVDRLHLVEPEPVANLREHRASAWACSAAAPRTAPPPPVRPPPSRSPTAIAHWTPACVRRPARRDPGLDGRLELLPDPRYREEPRGRTSGRYATTWRGSGQ